MLAESCAASAPVAAGAHEIGYALGIDPERLGAAAHPHPRALDLEIGIDPDRQPGPAAERQGPLDFPLGFAVEGDAGLDRGGEVGVALAGAREADRRWIRAGFQSEFQLASGSDVQSIRLPGNSV